MRFRSTLLAFSVLAAPSTLLAQPVTGPYVSLGAGINYLENQHITSGNPDINGPAKSNIGPAGVAAVGYGLGNGFRVELQGLYTESKTYRYAGQSTSGETEQYGGFANGYYDFDLSSAGMPGLTPYLGVGAGYEVNHLQNISYSTYNPALGTTNLFRTTGTAGNFAVQGIAGLAYDIAEVPGLAVTAEYRFTAQPEDESHNGQYMNTVLLDGKTKNNGAYNSTVLIGLRYALWQPAPPPPPAQEPPPPPPPPAAAPARTYLVFFDWDRADLTPRAREIVAQAASASTHVQTTKIEVNGYTDLSGTAQYNQKLSVRRAQAVEAELVSDGVPQAEIDIHGYGESNPLVPTAKGVREPQNRRVEIILK